jgi:shikimate kinase
MRRHGKVVWLKAAPETIRRRMLADDRSRDDRPALTAAGELGAEIAQTLPERVPLYSRAADFEVDTDGFEVGEVCEAIVSHLLSR